MSHPDYIEKERAFLATKYQNEQQKIEQEMVPQHNAETSSDDENKIKTSHLEYFNDQLQEPKMFIMNTGALSSENTSF